MSEKENVQNQSSKNVYEDFVTCIKELALQEEMKEKRETGVESSENSLEQQEETKENVQGEKGAKELPNLPEKCLC